MRKIARRTADITTSHFGAKAICLQLVALASALWANIKWVPNDVDIVVTSDGPSEQFDPEEIKKGIVEAYDRYYIQGSKKPGTNYKVLFCNLSGFRKEGRYIQVDILIPLKPRLWIPKFLSEDIWFWFIKKILVMPLFDLLVMKMQGRRDHRASRSSDFRA